ncbi:MAG: Fe-S cluster assembly protein SufD [Chitinophagaceae bacterium]
MSTMNNMQQFKERFDQQPIKPGSMLEPLRRNAFNAFNAMGIPTTRNEEWKYTRISSLFNKSFDLAQSIAVDETHISTLRLPGHEQSNELVFVNGIFSSELSSIRSKALVVLPLEDAAEKEEYKDIIYKHLGHSSQYLRDGIHALNTAFMQQGIFIQVKRGQLLEHPIYIYNIADARINNILSQPRSLVHVAEAAQVQMVETFATLGAQESFTSQVMEVVVEKDAIVDYYKIQNDASHTSQVSTTHIRQVGKSVTYTVTISLDGNIVRNNLNVVLEAAHCEAHLYGLYMQRGQSHIDNHTVVDNVQPNCESNELYKGIMDEGSTGVFNGKIFVRQPAQKTNAYQSNKNVLLSDAASINAKPQLEIFADDVKCSHGCTVGQLDEEGLFYLQSRGIGEKNAKALLLHAFAVDILEKIKLAPIRDYVDQLITERLELETITI